MNCEQAQRQLCTAVDFVATVPEGALLAHLQQCPLCRALAEEQRLQSLLHSLPVPRPSPGFAERALEQAWQQHVAQGESRDPSSRRGAIARWPMAAAASVLAVAGGFALLLNQLPEQHNDVQVAANSAPAADVVNSGADSLRQVDLLLISGSDYPTANITLRLDENLSLQGHPGRRAVQWQTHIAAGNNQLTLPVALDSGESGGFTVEIESHGVVKTATFTVSNKNAMAINGLAVHIGQLIANEV